MRTGASDVSSRGLRGHLRLNGRLEKARKARLRRSALEWLEARTLLAVLPAVQVGGPIENLSNEQGGGNMSSPQVVVDRYNPNHLVSIWVRNDPASTNFQSFIEAAYSNDGGVTWSGFNATDGQLIDTGAAPANPPVVYSQSINPSVAFDNNHNVYVLAQQTNGGNTSGILLLKKFNFTNASPVQVGFTDPNTGQFLSSQIIRQYTASQDALTNPTLTIDDNVATFTDPVTGAIQNDPYAGNVWIGWSTIETKPSGNFDFTNAGFAWNANSTQVTVSSDGGQTFSSSNRVNNVSTSAGNAWGRWTGQGGTYADATPKIAVGPGTPGGASGGNAAVVWDNFGIANADFDSIQSSSVSGGVAIYKAGQGGPINQATVTSSGPYIPQDTQFTTNISITDPRFLNLSSLTVKMTLQQTDMTPLMAVLTAPNGTQILLFRNAQDASGTTPQNVPYGVTGANLGIVGIANNAPYGLLGTTFDDMAARSITDRGGAAAGYTSTFRPEGNLNVLRGLTAAQLNGTWTLTFTDFRNNGTNNPPPQLFSWGINITSGVTASPIVNVASTTVRGSQSGTYPRASAAAGPQGIGPGIDIAQDNTLGSFSVHQGRIYITYVNHTNYQAGSWTNPADNTDVYLVTSDNGGSTWTNRGIVNDDQGSVDGYSEANKDFTQGQISGRAQFLPSVVVDQSTGTLVMSWRDGRDDAGRARSSIYLTSSIDGGQTFSPQTYANPSQTSIDAVTGQQVVLSPEGDNFSAITPKAPTAFGFGSQMGLAVGSGQVYTAWTGNFNQAYYDAGAGLVRGYSFQTYLRRMTIAAGPRIVDSTMGPVGTPGDTVNVSHAPDGSTLANTFTVTYDRPIDPQAVINAGQATFTTAAVLVYYHDTVNGDAFIPLKILAAQPIPSSAVGPNGAFGYTQFKVVFDPTTKPNGTPTGLTTNFAGTYSYIIAPTVSDEVRSIIPTGVKLGNRVDQNTDGVAGQNPLTTAFTGMTPGDAYVSPMPTPKAITTFGPNPLSLLVPPFSTSTLPLIVPGPHVVNTAAPGGTGADNLVLNGSTSSLLVTFDRLMNASSFTSADILQILGPTGSLVGPQYFNSNTTSQTIAAPPAANTPSTLNSKLTVPSFNGTFKAAKVAVQLNISFPTTSGLTVRLIAPDGTTLTLFAAVGGNGSNFTNTILDDAATIPIAAGSAPFTGSYTPSGAGGLAVFNGKSIEGDWTLQVVNSRGGTVGTLNSWALSVTPVIGVTPVSPVNGAATTFSINFPQQSLSGTYTIQLSPNIFDTNVNAQNPNGQPLDTNLNAGLDVLRGEAANVPTTTVGYGSGNVNLSLVGGQIASTINVPDNFPIQGITASGRTGLRLQINLATNNVNPLTATLVYHPGTANAPSVVLFSGLVQGPNTGGFVNTLFDDAAPTPISQSSPPYFTGPYNPKTALGGFTGLASGGTWQLLISSSGGTTATLNNWSLVFEKPLPTSGLGEPVADQANASFRIFEMNPTNALSRDSWTAVGPAPIATGSGRIGALAQDPSDPSGNTFFVGGASGGIWKTNNFLTTAPQGPTYVPLTDFGPTNGLNIGSIAVFGRNNDTNQSIIIASTGEGDTNSPGVGFLISKDGGATWALLDSTTNVDSSGNPLALDSPLRDRNFVGATSFKVVVDPVATVNGGVIIYAALSGRNGGLWRSVDTGAHWQLMRAGNATDVVLDPSSATGGDGNLQVVYAAFQGDGVYLSPNRGQTWNQMTGGVGNPLIYDLFDNTNVAVAAGQTPNGAHGRIVLAKPFLTNSAVQNQLYAGWLYAAVSNADGSFFGLYMTKDYGQNWVQVRVATLPPALAYIPSIPTNDVSRADYPLTGGAGNYNITLAIDPTNPNVVYVGGIYGEGRGTGMIRVDATKVWDAHNLTLFSDIAKDGAIDLSSTGPVAIGPIASGYFTQGDYLNYIRDPNDPFNSSTTLYVSNLTQFANNGFGVTWTPFDAPTNDVLDYHRLFTMVDPVTGLPRLIFGTGQGIWSVLDDNGVQLVGSSVGTQPTPGASRNGNLQITQFYYGSAQPTNTAVAASYDKSLFYGGSFGNSSPSSTGNGLNTGNLGWYQTASPFGAGTYSYQSATDQQGYGTVFQSYTPGSMGVGFGTTFFRVNHVSRTFGLFQQSGGGDVPDPQWPAGQAAPFTVNPLSGNQLMISSAVGRIFSTENQGVTWFEIGGPAVFGNPGAFSQALAYGAPDPGAPGGIGNLGNFMYVGTNTGQVYITRTAGGGDGSNWFNVSLGLDGSSVKQIVTNPIRGTHSAFAITTTGVFFLKDSVLLSQNPTNQAYAWVNITGNLRNLTYTIFGQSYNQNTDPNAIKLSQSLFLNAIAADWRYTIPNSTSDLAGPGYHPVLYVSGDSGVFRSLDDGQTWTLFPDQSVDGALAQGGYLPRTNITDLDLSLGAINPATGMPNLLGPLDPYNPTAASDPGVLLASTFGRGSFAIKTSPLVLPGTVKVNPADVNGIAADGTPLVQTSVFRVLGLSSFTGFNNATRITIFDVTDNKIIGGFDPSKPSTNAAINWTDSFGNFTIKVNAGAIPSNGLKVLQIYATDDTGATGNLITLTITLNASDLGSSAVPADPTLGLYGPDNTGIVPAQNYTNKPQPRFVGVTSAGATVELLYKDGNGNFVSFNPPVVTTSAADGSFTLQFPNLGVQGTFTVKAKASNAAGPAKNLSNGVVFTIKTTGPTAPPTLLLNPYYDSGIVGDNVTNVRKPVFTGTIGAANAGSIIRIYAAQNGAPSGSILAQTTADSSGNFSVQLPLSLSDGAIQLVATAVDAAGNPAPGASSGLAVTIVSVALDYSGNPIDYNTGLNLPLPPAPVYAQSETGLFFRNSTSGFGQWYTIYTPPSFVPSWFPNGIALGSAGDIPLTGDFDGDGKADLATFNRTTATWVLYKSSQSGSAFQFGTAGSSLPIVGNFDGPGATQYGVFDVVNGVGVWTLTTPSSGIRQYGFGTTGDVPLTGDFDGVGRDQLAVYRPSTGQFIVFVPASGNQPASTHVVATMQPNMIPVPGRYDDLYYFNNHLPYKTEAAVYDPNSGAFTIARPAGAYFPTQAVFQPGDIPVPADYAGVGWTIPGVYRPSTGQYLVKYDQSAVNGADSQVSNFSGAVGLPVVPIGAPLAYRMPGSASLTVMAAPTASASTASATTTTVAAAVLADQTPPAPAAPDQTQTQTTSAPAASPAVVPSLTYASINAAGTRQPWFTGSAAPGIVVDFFLSGKGVVGNKKVGSANVDANGYFYFQLPSGAQNGVYTLLVKARGADGSSTPIASTTFQVAPLTARTSIKKAPMKVNLGHAAKPTTLARPKTAAIAPRSAAPAQRLVVAKAAPAAAVTTNVFDQAIQNLHKNRLTMRNES
ncbi:Ig-like domain-containing protein [Paludisphaera borealis]|uniref:Ig-like domain-containing protein n=1 Tax=Paludisphaera borealis TaxID=1387353 RepID=UPI00143D7A98|nr:Ig-like domain-containing protein [Paludisphaera borealis]